MGPGWGGPAEGAGSGGPARPFTADSPTRNTGYGNRSPEKKAEKKCLTAEQEARKKQMIQMLGDLALNSENPIVCIIAADKALDRLVGRPVVNKRNESRNTTLEEMIQATQAPKVVGRSDA